MVVETSAAETTNYSNHSSVIVVRLQTVEVAVLTSQKLDSKLKQLQQRHQQCRRKSCHEELENGQRVLTTIPSFARINNRNQSMPSAAVQHEQSSNCSAAVYSASNGMA